MIEQLFGSKTRVKLLGLFYQNPNRSFYVREITRKIDEQINSVRRELANLLSIGIIKSDNSNNKLYYEVNQAFEHYDALEAMFGNQKKRSKKSTKKPSEGEPTDTAEESKIEEPDFQSKDENLENIVKSGNVRLLVYTGQFTRDNRPGVDVFIVGDINIPNLEHAIEKLEQTEKREVRYSVFTPEEFSYRRQINDRFVSDILLAKKLIHIDRDNYLK